MGFGVIVFFIPKWVACFVILIGVVLIPTESNPNRRRNYFRIVRNIFFCIFLVSGLLVYSARDGDVLLYVFYDSYIVFCISFIFSQKIKFVSLVAKIAVISIFPIFVLVVDYNSYRDFEKLCATNYEYKIYKKLELPRKYFHEATDKEISQSKDKLKAGDLVPNVEIIRENDIKNISTGNKKIDNDIIWDSSMNCKETSKILEKYGVNLDSFNGHLFCTNIKYDNDKNYEYRESNVYEMMGNIEYAHDKNYRYYGGMLSEFIMGSRNDYQSCKVGKGKSTDVNYLIELKK